MQRLPGSTYGLLVKTCLLSYFLLLFVPSTPFFTPEFFLCLAFVTFLASGEPDWSIWWEDSVLFWWVLFCGWISFTSLIDGFWLSGRYVSWFEHGTSFALLAMFKNLPISALLIVFMVYELIRQGDQNDWFFVRVLLWAVYAKLLLVGFVDYVHNAKWVSGGNLVAYAHHNLTGSLLNLFLPVVLCELYHSKKWLARAGWLVLFYAGFNAVYMTQSRGAIIAMIMALVVLCFLYLIYNFSRRSLVICNLLGVIAIGFLLINPARQFTHDSFEKTTFEGMEGLKQRSSPIGGFSGRVNLIWPQTTEALKRRPVIGYMLGSYPDVMRKIHGSEKHGHRHPHSVSLQLLFDGGIIGFLLFHVFGGYFLLRTLRTLVKTGGLQFYGAGAGIAGFSEIYFHGIVAMFDYFWIVFLLPWLFIAEFRERKNAT